ncbi:MAG: carbamoyltransferase HypF [Desulfuromonas sp.]|nr:MAG: carbamoyltransferase HypF [Desulfuromonas sp.]
MVTRCRLEIEGVVQGVGFRPFVYQLASRFTLTGSVLNDSRGVEIEIEGEPWAVDAFIKALQTELPPLASISQFRREEVALKHDTVFIILASRNQIETRAQISPDTWVCPDCREELFNPEDRRFRYPFINCTNCGPRYSIVTGVPYDRPLTTMADFTMCPRCQSEYDDPASRRFHAQPNACPDCGPQLTFYDSDGRDLPGDPLKNCRDALRSGDIVAIKGIGGYHLAVDASNDAAVQRLRQRKLRDEKPFAVMSRRLAQVMTYAEVDKTEAKLLASVERPIVLLRQKNEFILSSQLAPHNRYVGVMLPYAPLHELLLEEDFVALVMTSGNRSDEPIAFEDNEARQRLAGIADYFLGHDRRIHIRTDDSIARVMAKRPLLLRRSRGYVPRGILLPAEGPSILALGGELKNTFCLTRGDRAYLSQHVGDLKNPETHDSFGRLIDHLKCLLDVQPQYVVHDLHPDYFTTRFSEGLSGVELLAVQHHHAHFASCLTENGYEGEAVGIIFDGIGYGDDGHIWGGEFFVGNANGYHRVGHLQEMAMPGGDAATREPWRMALSLLIQTYGDDLPELPLVQRRTPQELKLLRQMIEQGINSPLTSSCGRLFDAVAALADLREQVSYEGQAALELEMALCSKTLEEPYPFEWLSPTEQGKGWQLDVTPMVRAITNDLNEGGSAGIISARFHRMLAEACHVFCRMMRQEYSLHTVALSGGVFQNRTLTELLVDGLRGDGFTVLTHSLVPPNDGGLALGQAAVAARQKKDPLK